MHLYQGTSGQFIGSAERRPTAIVGRAAAREVPGTWVQMSASRFLISVLPRALSTDTGERALAIAVAETGRTFEILGATSVALEPTATEDERCAAIDELARERVGLDAIDLTPLLEQASLPIATYALGLVRDSPDAAALVAMAMARAEAAPESPVAKEARLLSA